MLLLLIERQLPLIESNLFATQCSKFNGNHNEFSVWGHHYTINKIATINCKIKREIRNYGKWR